MLLFAISHRTFNLDKATNIQLGATVSGGRQYLEDSYKEARVFGSSEVGFNYYKITSLSYMKGQGENRYLQEVTSLFSSNPFNTHSVCSGESLDHIQSITFYLPKSNLRSQPPPPPHIGTSD